METLGEGLVQGAKGTALARAVVGPQSHGEDVKLQSFRGRRI